MERVLGAGRVRAGVYELQFKSLQRLSRGLALYRGALQGLLRGILGV